MRYHIVILFLFLGATGCVGPATRTLHHSSLRFDPVPKRYVAAWRSDTHAYVQYEPDTPSREFQETLSSNYWASVPLEQLDDYRFNKWTVYRKEPPHELQKQDLPRIQVVDISGFKKPEDRVFLNRDQFLTYIIDSQGYALPVLLYDIGNYHRFHLVGPRQLHGSYRGLWNPPKGTYRDRSVILKNSWKYPFTMLLDIVLYPVNKWLGHAFRNWT